MVIAIDGPAGSGKSTIAALLAERLGFTYINSGNLYRAITLGCLRLGIRIHDEQSIIHFAENIPLDYHNGVVFLDGKDITAQLHCDEVDGVVAVLSSIAPVRHIINRHIKNIAGRRDVVVEGRDMTTVVFPDAAHRFFLDASASSRAKRRFEQGVSTLSYEDILMNIEERDKLDRQKAVGSLRIGDGVTCIDTSLLTIEQTYEKLLNCIQCKG
jgi:cytidylate kinase